MMSKYLFTLAFIIAFCFSAQAQDAKAIIQKMDDKLQGDSNKSEMKMSIVRPKYTRTIAFKNWSLGRDYFMTYVTSPSKDRGMVSMKYKNEMWSYTPSINRMIKLPPSMMSQGWMGSDFTNDDLVKEASSVVDYDHKLLSKETISNKDCYKIEMIPKPSAAIVWEKVIVWIDIKDFLQLKAEFYDEDGELINIMNSSEVKEIGGRKITSKIEMLPIDKKGNSTVIIYNNIIFNKPINENFFTTRNMKQIK